jgi:hypothetical protein
MIYFHQNGCPYCAKLVKDNFHDKKLVAKLQKSAIDSHPQVIKLTSCLPMVGGSLRVLRLLPPLKLVAMIVCLVTEQHVELDLSSANSWKRKCKMNSYCFTKAEIDIIFSEIV